MHIDPRDDDRLLHRYDDDWWTPPAGRRHPHGRRRIAPGAGAVLLAAIALAILLALAWRAGGSEASSPTATPVGTRTWRDTRLDVPTGWIELAHGRDWVTWGSRDRAHTVTLGIAPASVLPLPGVVRSATRTAVDELPGARWDGEIELIDAADVGAGDTAASARLRVPVPHDEIPATEADTETARFMEVVQVWHRDERGARDLVATWTSADGRWPTDPLHSLPLAWSE